MKREETPDFKCLGFRHIRKNFQGLGFRVQVHKEGIGHVKKEGLGFRFFFLMGRVTCALHRCEKVDKKVCPQGPEKERTQPRKPLFMLLSNVSLLLVQSLAQPHRLRDKEASKHNRQQSSPRADPKQVYGVRFRPQVCEIRPERC